MSVSRYSTLPLQQNHYHMRGQPAHGLTIQSSCRPPEGWPHLATCHFGLDQPVRSRAYGRSLGQSYR